MGNGEQSVSGGQRNWPVTLAGMVGAGAGAAVALFVVKPLVELPFWLGLIAFGVMVGVGIVLGRLAGSLMFRGAPGNGPRA
jgi:hypothetical protein